MTLQLQSDNFEKICSAFFGNLSAIDLPGKKSFHAVKLRLLRIQLGLYILNCFFLERNGNRIA